MGRSAGGARMIRRILRALLGEPAEELHPDDVPNIFDVAAAQAMQQAPDPVDDERKARAAQAATPAAQETGPEPVAPAGPAVHEGATEAYGDQLAAHRAALTLTDIPIVDDTDTGAAILRVRRHVDDILVALVGDDAEQLAAVRKAADVTGQWDGRGLWALLAAEDAEAQLVGAGVPR
jgi:hypothetical protein